MPTALTTSLLFLMTVITSTIQTTPPPAYDVATIRPSTPARSFHVSISVNDDIFHAENVTLRDLLQDAFGLQHNLIFGLPPWAESTRYDLNAKVLDANLQQLHALTPPQQRAMFVALYENRFGLKWHYETRVMPAYELLVAKSGPKFQPAGPHAGSDGTSMHNGDLTITNMPVSALVQVLSNYNDRPVVDKTDLTGKYDMHLKWSRDEAQTSADAGRDIDTPPPLFTALEEQLGLKLRPGKDPIQVVVIDTVAPPTVD